MSCLTGPRCYMNTDIEETMGGMDGVLHDTIGFAWASCTENIQDGGERGTDDFCSCVHSPLEGLAVCCTTVPVPDSDAAGQHALHGSPVESGEDEWRETCSFQPLEKVRERKRKNLVLLTLSTVELSMISEGWSPEVHQKLLCLTNIEGQVVSTTPFSQLCHFISVVFHPVV